MKFFSLVSTAAAIAFSSVFAGDLVSHQTGGSGGGYSSSYQNSQSMSQQTMRPQTVLECARVCSCGDGFYTDLEFLWLRAVEDGLTFAWETTNVATVNAQGRHLKVKDQDFEFDPGFRVGIGYNFGYDCWDLHLNYMWLYSYPKNSVTGTYDSNRGSIIGLLGILPSNNGSLEYLGFESAKTSWQLQFNSWDLDLGRNYYVGSHLALKPTLGLKGSLIRQHLNGRFTNSDNSGGNPPDFSNVVARAKSRWWGVGPKAGVSGRWELGSGFSIIGSTHVSLLYGNFDTRYRIKAIEDRDQNEDTGGRFTDDNYRLRPMGYLSIGLDWGRCFWDWMAFSMHLGWECNYWWQQMEWVNFKDITPDGDFSLTGLNAGIRFDF